jgi:hypothetical protein
LDELDKIDVICAINANEQKCQTIAEINKNPMVIKQIEILNTILTIYIPICIRIVLLIENVINKLSNEPTCNIDSTYLKLIKDLKKRIIGSMYMNNIKDLDFKNANNKLRDMSSQGIIPPRIEEHFTVTSDNVSFTYYDLLIVIVIVLFIYFYFCF